MRRAPANRAGGFTLVELITSLGILTILLGAITSALVLATRALPDGSSALEAVARGGSALEQMTCELHTAIAVSSATSTAIEFSIHDRDGGGTPETIRYAWSGTPGDPLTREYNGGSPAEVLESVDLFDLAYDRKTESQEVQGAPVESGRQSLMGYVSGPYLSSGNVSSANWWGEYFKPTLPAEAEAWSVDSVYLRARQAGTPDGQTKVQLHPARADFTPEATVLEEVVVDESSFPEPSGFPTWKMISFTSVRNLSPDEGLCVVLVTDDVDSWETEYFAGGATLPNAGMLWSPGDEEDWSFSDNMALRFMVYGTVTTPGELETVDVYYLCGVRIALQPGSEPSTRLETEVQVLNAPQVTGP